jgi:hypothetical protein
MVASACATLVSDSVVSITAQPARTGAPRTRASATRRPRKGTPSVEQLRALPIAGHAGRSIPSTGPISRPTKALLKEGEMGTGGVEPPSSSVSANPGNRCANRRCPRSRPTVEAEGKRSLDVQLKRYPSTLPLRPRVAPRPALTRQCIRPSMHQPRSRRLISQPVSPRRKTKVPATVMSASWNGSGQVGPAAQDMAMTVGPSRLG